MQNLLGEEVFSVCCFTGHRPNKFPWGNNERDIRCFKYKASIQTKVLSLINNGVYHFICGGAIGFDMYCAEIVLLLKEQYPDIKLEVAVPCENQHSLWNKDFQMRYLEILKKADIVTYVSREYTSFCMSKRNDYMLNKSDIVVAGFVEGTTGGTANTIKKAQKLGKKIIFV